jgi:hypothetical protein
LRPFNLLNDRSALSTLYRSLEVAPEGVRGFAKYGILEADAAIPIDGICFIDTATFLTVIQSLPPGMALEMTAKENALYWSVFDDDDKARAEGKIATVSVDKMPFIKDANKNARIKLAPHFIEGLELGALSADKPSLVSVDLYGVVIDNRSKELVLCSSDDVTISVAIVGKSNNALPEQMTIHPLAMTLLQSIADSRNGSAVFTDKGITYEDARYRCFIPQIAPLRSDLAPVYEPFLDAEHLVPIERERVAAFIRRVNALGENKNDINVNFGVRKGRLQLSFKEGTVSSTEYYVVQDNALPDIADIPLKATTVARALQHVNSIALDHVERRVLVFHGEDPMFRYMVSAHEPKDDS